MYNAPVALGSGDSFSSSLSLLAEGQKWSPQDILLYSLKRVQITLKYPPELTLFLTPVPGPKATRAFLDLASTVARKLLLEDPRRPALPGIREGEVERFFSHEDKQASFTFTPEDRVGWEEAVIENLWGDLEVGRLSKIPERTSRSMRGEEVASFLARFLPVVLSSWEGEEAEVHEGFYVLSNEHEGESRGIELKTSSHDEGSPLRRAEDLVKALHAESEHRKIGWERYRSVHGSFVAGVYFSRGQVGEVLKWALEDPSNVEGVYVGILEDQRGFYWSMSLNFRNRAAPGSPVIVVPEFILLRLLLEDSVHLAWEKEEAPSSSMETGAQSSTKIGAEATFLIANPDAHVNLASQVKVRGSTADPHAGWDVERASSLIRALKERKFAKQIRIEGQELSLRLAVMSLASIFGSPREEEEPEGFVEPLSLCVSGRATNPFEKLDFDMEKKGEALQMAILSRLAPIPLLLGLSMRLGKELPQARAGSRELASALRAMEVILDVVAQLYQMATRKEISGGHAPRGILVFPFWEEPRETNLHMELVGPEMTLGRGFRSLALYRYVLDFSYRQD